MIRKVILFVIIFHFLFITQANTQITIQPPFSQAQSGHNSTPFQHNFGLRISGSIHDLTQDNIDTTNGFINQNTISGAGALGGARTFVDDYIDIPLPIGVSTTGIYEINVTGTYSDMVHCAGASGVGWNMCQYDAAIEARLFHNGLSIGIDWYDIPSVQDDITLQNILSDGLIELLKAYFGLTDPFPDVNDLITSIVTPVDLKFNESFVLNGKVVLDPNVNYSLRIYARSMTDAYAGGISALVASINMSVNISKIEIHPSNISSQTIDLSIQSLPSSGISISIDKQDSFGQQDGLTPFTRNYYINNVVQVTAPANNDGYKFKEWRVNDRFYSAKNPVELALNEDAKITAVYHTDKPPILVNPHVTPTSGTEATSFEFIVDYFDPDGNPPIIDYRKIIFSDGTEGSMTLKSGTHDNGTYSFSTTRSAGSYSYRFSFADTSGKISTTNWNNGPNVFTNANIVINPVIQSTKLSSDLKLGYSITGLGNWTYLLISNSNILDPLVLPAGARIYFEGSTGSPNFTYNGRQLIQSGNILDDSPGSTWWYDLNPGEYGLDVFYQYTPQNYTISGTIKQSDGSLIPGGVNLLLSSSQNFLRQTSNDGTFSFFNVSGGVDVNITPLAKGYAFTPPSLVYMALRNDDSVASIIAYPSDTIAPSTSFVTTPLPVDGSSSVNFSWTGQDDASSPDNLSYQYKLDGVDTDWSTWTSNTTKSYDVPNGTYIFWVRAQDEAGNINQAPSRYNFIVNAAPEVTSSVHIDRSVWASRVTLTMPSNSSNPTSNFILTPQHSGSADPELVPVRIYLADNTSVIGVNEIVASQLGLPAIINKSSNGWLVTLPQNVPLGQSEQYDVIWGKIKYFGWQDFVSIPDGFSNGGNVDAYFLDDNLQLWRSAFKWFDKGGQGDTCDRDAWLFMDINNNNGVVKDDSTLRFMRGQCVSGLDGTSYRFFGKRFYKLGNNVLFSWLDEQYNRQYPNSRYYYRYGLELLDNTGYKLNEIDGSYVEDSDITFPKELINNSLWFTGVDSGSRYDDPRDAWYHVIDTNGNEKIQKTVIDTIQNSNGSDIYRFEALPLGNNILLLWERYWNATSNPHHRQEIAYQVLTTSGSVVKSKDIIHPPVLPNSEAVNDYYSLETMLTDRSGKVWISFLHRYYNPDRIDDYYYIIFDTDGSVWREPVQTAYARRYVFVDKEGYIWVTENGQFFALNPDDTINVSPRTLAYTPNQEVGQIAAQVSPTGYRLYDRWSPQSLVIDVPNNVNPDTMEVYDLNLWNNDLHPSNVQLSRGTTLLWSHNGQFTGSATVNISGVLNQGVNVLEITQDDFLGGQILVTFPYEPPLIDYYCDYDNDGQKSLSVSDTCLGSSCLPEGCQVTPGNDCDDSDRDRFPGNPEVCDNKDNDCNVLVDENYIITPTNCGVGACSALGQLECQNGAEVNTCIASTPGVEGPYGDQTCSGGLDEDCDGATDNNDEDCIIHPYDDNQDWVIDDFELLNAIDDWALGNLGDFELLDLIDFWAAGCYHWDASSGSHKSGC